MSPVPSPHQSHLLCHGTRKEKRMRKVDTFAPHNDGHQWRKYGEKKINNCNFPRYYYRCTYKDNINCPATKQIQQKDYSDPPLYSVTYYNEHTCNSAFLPLNPTEFQLQNASGKAVSICFDSSGAQEPITNASSPSSSAARRSTPSENKNQPLLQRSEAYSWGAGVVEQKPVCTELQSCSTQCQDTFSSGAVSEEMVRHWRLGIWAPPDPVQAMAAAVFMELALEQAKLALGNLEVPVGCVIVEDGKVISSGSNRTNATRNATRHAEMEAIDALLREWQSLGLEQPQVAEKFAGCDLYVTCEPCIMCATALSIIGIREVYFGCANDKFGGCGSIMSLHKSSSSDDLSGSQSPRPRGFKCTGGILAEEAVALFRSFYEQGNPNAPKPHRPVRVAQQ